MDIDELQSLDSHKVVQHKAREAYKILQKPVLVDDVTLACDALNGLPGTLVRYFLESVGPAGIAKMVSAYDDKSATATVLFGLFDGKSMQVFEGVTEGAIAGKPGGDPSTPSGHGWNSIFIPNGQNQGENKTFAEMSETEVAKYSPRNKAVVKLKKFLN